MTFVLLSLLISTTGFAKDHVAWTCSEVKENYQPGTVYKTIQISQSDEDLFSQTVQMTISDVKVKAGPGVLTAKPIKSIVVDVLQANSAMIKEEGLSKAETQAMFTDLARNFKLVISRKTRENPQSGAVSNLATFRQGKSIPIKLSCQI
jgi:hypothetical protein